MVHPPDLPAFGYAFSLPVTLFFRATINFYP